MAQAVKGSRRYVSARRAEQARQTRREIIAAAHRLLVEQGYTAATISAVAQEAGVALQTIYTAVGNKRALLRAVIESAIAGDDPPPSSNDSATRSTARRTRGNACAVGTLTAAALRVNRRDA